MQLSHIAQLELSHDGRIPPRLREAAETLDRIEASTRKRTTARTRTRIVKLTPKGRVERLAEAMVEIAAFSNTCTRRDLIRRGFSAEDLDAYGDKAIARAEEIKADRERRS